MASDLPPDDLARVVTSEVRTVHARTLVSDVVDVERQIDATLIGERLLSRLGGGFAALALVLACIGLYGTLSYSVVRRRAELGIRIALGARPLQLMSAVARQVMVPVGLGLASGMPFALLVARFAEQMLFGVSARDGLTYAAAAAALVVAATIACLGPARRAAAIDPIEAIRTT